MAPRPPTPVDLAPARLRATRDRAGRSVGERHPACGESWPPGWIVARSPGLRGLSASARLTDSTAGSWLIPVASGPPLALPRRRLRPGLRRAWGGCGGVGRGGDGTDSETDIMNESPRGVLPQGREQCRFLKGCQLFQECRVRDRHMQDAATHFADPRVAAGRFPGRRVPGVFQLFLRAEPSQAPQGEEVAQDITQRLGASISR